MGLHRAGFEVIGVDIKPQPRYPFRFVQADALRPPFDLSRLDFIWASPPCQGYTQMSARYRGKGGVADAHPKLIADVRRMLETSGASWAIENVVGARSEMPGAFVLRGAHFGLRVDRPRLIETSFFLLQADSGRRRRDIVGVYGTKPDGRRLWKDLRAARGLAEGSEAMGIDWMEWDELTESIPPAYSEFIGRAALASLANRSAA